MEMFPHLKVVYLLIPTSNHNSGQKQKEERNVVYLLIPTSNHNCKSDALVQFQLYIF